MARALVTTGLLMLLLLLLLLLPAANASFSRGIRGSADDVVDVDMDDARDGVENAKLAFVETVSRDDDDDDMAPDTEVERDLATKVSCDVEGFAECDGARWGIAGGSPPTAKEDDGDDDDDDDDDGVRWYR